MDAYEARPIQRPARSPHCARHVPANRRGRRVTAIGIYGSSGRMGRAIAEQIAVEGATLAGGVDAGGDPAALAALADVLVDFSAPSALEAHLAIARAARTPIVIGTTGLTQAQHGMIDAAAADIAVLQTGNTSLGVTLLAQLVREAARHRLGYRDRRKPPSPQGRRAVRHRDPARRGGGGGAGDDVVRTARRRPRRAHRRPDRGDDRACLAARRIGDRRSPRHLRQ